MLTLGVVALLLSFIGIYGVVAFFVNLRSKEMGIRMALGANKIGIVGLVLSSALRPILAGLAVGIVMAVAGAQVMARVLSETPVTLERWDPAVYVAATIVIMVAAVVAVLRPASRAIGVDPMVALRCE